MEILPSLERIIDNSKQHCDKSMDVWKDTMWHGDSSSLKPFLIWECRVCNERKYRIITYKDYEKHLTELVK